MTYKIRLTDSVTIAKFSILKPEVEKEFQIETHEEAAVEKTQALLEEAVYYQLEQLADRMTDKQKREALTDVSVDGRFKTVIKSTLN